MTDHKPITDAEAKEWKVFYKRVTESVLAERDINPNWFALRLLADRKVAMEIIKMFDNPNLGLKTYLGHDIVYVCCYCKAEHGYSTNFQHSKGCIVNEARTLITAVKGGE